MQRCLFVFVLCFLLDSCRAEPPDIVPLYLEHAISLEQHKKGLSGRDHLEEDHGMLFHFRRPKMASFWMYQTRFDLAIAFLDKQGVIMEIAEMKAYPEQNSQLFFYRRMTRSKAPASYALEMPSNWFARKGIQAGDRLHWRVDEESAYITRQK